MFAPLGKSPFGFEEEKRELEIVLLKTSELKLKMMVSK